MISNDERREVAARLREQKTWDIFTDFEYCIGELCDAVFEDEGDLNDMFRLQAALANLIEPEQERTCNAEQIPYIPGGYEGYWCSVCHCIDLESDEPNYCPNCGAKVVE